MKKKVKLTENEKKSLQTLMSNGGTFRVRKRAQCILLSSRGYKIKELANIFDVDRDTISDWINRWKKNGINGLGDAPRSGRPKK
jgi:transposase